MEVSRGAGRLHKITPNRQLQEMGREGGSGAMAWGWGTKVEATDEA